MIGLVEKGTAERHWTPSLGEKGRLKERKKKSTVVVLKSVTELTNSDISEDIQD